MQVIDQEVCRTDPNCDLLHGTSSWDPNCKAFKYGWKNINGHYARGGEFPVECLPQLIEFAIRRCGYKINFIP